MDLIYEKSYCQKLLQEQQEYLEKTGVKTTVVGIDDRGLGTLKLDLDQRDDAFAWVKAGAALIKKHGVPVYIQENFARKSGDWYVHGGYQTHPTRQISIGKSRVTHAPAALLTITHEAVHMKTDAYLKNGHQHPLAALAVGFSSEERFDDFEYYHNYYRLDEIKAFHKNVLASRSIEKKDGHRYHEKGLFEWMVRRLVPRSQLLLAAAIEHLEDFHRQNPNKVPPAFGWSWHFGDSKKEVNLSFVIPQGNKGKNFSVIVPYQFQEDIPEGHHFTTLDLDSVISTLKNAQAIVDGYPSRIENGYEKDREETDW
jgi:hypothetical protein